VCLSVWLRLGAHACVLCLHSVCTHRGQGRGQGAQAGDAPVCTWQGRDVEASCMWRVVAATTVGAPSVVRMHKAVDKPAVCTAQLAPATPGQQAAGHTSLSASRPTAVATHHAVHLSAAVARHAELQAPPLAVLAQHELVAAAAAVVSISTSVGGQQAARGAPTSSCQGLVFVAALALGTRSTHCTGAGWGMKCGGAVPAGRSEYSDYDTSRVRVAARLEYVMY
jgi:hypothetical protein